MKKKKIKTNATFKEYLLSSVALTFLSILYIVILKTTDVKMIGPKGTSVGLSSINLYFKNLLGSNMTIYKVTEVFGLIAIAIAGIYALLGLLQLVKRKSIKEVDKKIISLGILYALVVIVYVLFEKVIINYRPVLMDGEIEASFPSSHTMLAICICVSAILTNKNYIKNKNYLKITNIFIVAIMLVVVIGRFISGVHWFTDIMGGLIISITLLNYYLTIDHFLEKK